jgi:hypothetical protein
MGNLVAVASFDLLPMDEIDRVLFNFTQSAPYNDRLYELGYQSTNSIESLGSLFIFAILIPARHLFKHLIWGLCHLPVINRCQRFMSDPT